MNKGFRRVDYGRQTTAKAFGRHGPSNQVGMTVTSRPADEFWFEIVNSHGPSSATRIVLPRDKAAELVHCLQELLEEAV